MRERTLTIIELVTEENMLKLNFTLFLLGYSTEVLMTQAVEK
jgi:hypothetical protein